MLVIKDGLERTHPRAMGALILRTNKMWRRPLRALPHARLYPEEEHQQENLVFPKGILRALREDHRPPGNYSILGLLPGWRPHIRNPQNGLSSSRKVLKLPTRDDGSRIKLFRRSLSELPPQRDTGTLDRWTPKCPPRGYGWRFERPEPLDCLMRSS